MELHYRFAMCGRDLISLHACWVSGIHADMGEASLPGDSWSPDARRLLQGTVAKTNLHQCTNGHLLLRLFLLLSHNKPVCVVCVSCVCVCNGECVLLSECVCVCVRVHVCVWYLIWYDWGRKWGACSLFILQINLISNPDAEQCLVQREESALHYPDDIHINHRFYSSAVRGITDQSNVADSHWVMLHYLAKNPQGQNVI